MDPLLQIYRCFLYGSLLRSLHRMKRRLRPLSVHCQSISDVRSFHSVLMKSAWRQLYCIDIKYQPKDHLNCLLAVLMARRAWIYVGIYCTLPSPNKLVVMFAAILYTREFFCHWLLSAYSSILPFHVPRCTHCTLCVHLTFPSVVELWFHLHENLQDQTELIHILVQFPKNQIFLRYFHSSFWCQFISIFDAFWELEVMHSGTWN